VLMEVGLRHLVAQVLADRLDGIARAGRHQGADLVRPAAAAHPDRQQQDQQDRRQHHHHDMAVQQREAVALDHRMPHDVLERVLSHESEHPSSPISLLSDRQMPRVAYRVSSGNCATYPKAIQINRGRAGNQPASPIDSPRINAVAKRNASAASMLCGGSPVPPARRALRTGRAPTAEATTPMTIPATMAGSAPSPPSRRVGAYPSRASATPTPTTQPRNRRYSATAGRVTLIVSGRRLISYRRRRPHP